MKYSWRDSTLAVLYISLISFPLALSSLLFCTTTKSVKASRSNSTTKRMPSREIGTASKPLSHKQLAHYFQKRTSGSLRAVGSVSPLGTPTMIGAMGVNSSGIPSSALMSGVFSAGTAAPMMQVPSPIE
jgi:hypothetical protein